MIKLKGVLDWEITRFGVKEGDVIQEHTKPGTNGAIYFTVHYGGFEQNCVVWPDNYKIIEHD